MRTRFRPSHAVAGGALIALSWAAVAINTARTETIRSAPASSGNSDQDLQMASTWNLDALEWSRYQDLQNGIRGHLSDPGITPLEVLGIHARTSEERRGYARDFARLMYEDAARILAFQRAYDEAIRDVAGRSALVDVEQIRRRDAAGEPELAAGDSIVLVVKPECPACDRLLKDALRAAGRVRGMDLYVAGLGGPEAPQLKRWIQGVERKHPDIRSESVRIRPAQPLLQMLDRTIEDVPLLLRLRRGRFERLSTSALP